jgi:hypothetical protein
VARRVLFFIRGKLGDSLVLYSAVRRYVDQFPGDDVTLAIRRDYAFLLRKEAGFRLLPFGSRLEMMVRLFLLRFSRPFDVLAVLWGFGNPTRSLAKLVRAKRRIYFDSRFADVFPEWADLPRDYALVAPAVGVMRKFEPRLGEPRALSIPSLAALRNPSGVVAVVPVADEPRRNLDFSSLKNLLTEVRRRHPAAEIKVLVNPRNRGAEAILDRDMPERAVLTRFSNLADIVHVYRSLEAWYGTDTGLYHLAVAMGIPATVFFGPTQPWKIVMPEQPDMRYVRLQVLGESHCEEKGCGQPYCLYSAVASFTGSAPSGSLSGTPRSCPLRAHPERTLASIRVHEGPRPQARQDR